MYIIKMYRFLQNLPKIIRNTTQYSGSHLNNSHVPVTLETPENRRYAHERFTDNTSNILHSHGAISKFSWFNPLYLEAYFSQLYGSKNSYRAKSERGPRFRNSHSESEAVGWGTAIIIGIQLCRSLTAAHFPDSHSSSRKFSTLAQLLPILPHFAPSTHRSIVAEGSSTSDTHSSLNSTDSDLSENGNHIQLETEKSSGNLFQKALSQADKAIPVLEATLQKMEVIHQKGQGVVYSMIGAQYANMGDFKKAVEHFEIGSRLGSSKAQYNLGVCYEHGKGVNIDFNKASTLYHQAASQGHPLATYNFAVFILSGVVDCGTGDEGIQLMEEAAKAGVVHAQRYLGNYYLHDCDRDEGRAVYHLKMASQAGDPESQYLLGLCYEQGWGIQKNERRAVKLFYGAADVGYSLAQYSLGLYYEEGRGDILQSDANALDLFTKAASAGLEIAKEKLSRIRNTKIKKDLPVPTSPAMEDNQTHKPQQGHVVLSKPIESIFNNNMHTSSSEPSFQKFPVEDSKLKRTSITRELSYLSLILPYFFHKSHELFQQTENYENKASGVWEGSDGRDDAQGNCERVSERGDSHSAVSFQVGGDDHFGGAIQLSSNVVSTSVSC